jgi:predicted amidohydrolase
MGDLAHYTPGDHPSVWELRGVRCGALVCYDYRFPELYREYKREGVELVFHSFHAANVHLPRDHDAGGDDGSRGVQSPLD